MSGTNASGGSRKGWGTGARTGTGGPGGSGGRLDTPWPAPVPGKRGARVLVYLLLLVCGVLAALAGALVQDGLFPGGLLLALAGAVGLFWGGAKLCRTRLGAVAPGAGWVLTVLWLTAPRPEGDFVFGAGIGSYVFLVGGMLALVMCATIALPAPPVEGRKYR